MKFENTQIFNFEGAIRGMRFPMNSDDKIDSMFKNNEFIFGNNDLNLATKLANATSRSHGKFLRQIFVSVDITAPFYWWKEMDQYKIGTTTNSQSTMHKLASTPITIDCFETDDLSDENLHIGNYNCLKFMYNQIIDDCESLRQKYLETKDIRYWKELIRWLPESWLQKRHWTGNYEVIRNICNDRNNHKLTEWSDSFITWARTLPYAQELIFIDELEDKE